MNDHRTWWQVVFGCDLRSLAVFRIMLGLLVLLDVGLRWPDIEALYSDSGFFTRELADEYYAQTAGAGWSQAIWSVYSFRGDVRFVTGLFVVQGLAGLALALGAATRGATVLAWVLVASAQVRNPIVITSGDMLLKLMLFWSMFLPLGRLWSLDALRRGHTVAKEQALWRCSFATAGLILQVIIMYFFTGVAKFNSIWFEGVAMDFVWRLDIFANSWGKYLVQFSALSQFVAWATLFIELIGIWLLLIPWKNWMWRLLVMAAYWAFHLGIAATMTIGLFPLICMVAWLPLWPAEGWRRRTSPNIAAAPVSESAFHRWTAVVGNLVCAAMIGLMICWNLYNMNAPWTKSLMPKPLHYVGHWTAFYQHFQMFGVPPKVNPWFVFEAKLNDQQPNVPATTLDIFCTDGILNYQKPPLVRDTLPGHNWRRLLQNMLHQDLAYLRQPLLDYAVRKWNARNTETNQRQVRSAELFCYMQELGPGYREGDWVRQTWAVYRTAANDPGQTLDDLIDRMLNGNR